MRRRDFWRLVLFTACIFATSVLYPQFINVKGEVKEALTDRHLQEVEIRSGKTGFFTKTNEKGKFSIRLEQFGKDTLFFELQSYRKIVLPLETEGENMELGTIFMDKDRRDFPTNNLIELDNEALNDGRDDEINIGLLRASRDIIARRAAFDFSQVFFRIRGYDTRSGIVLINGIPMNRMLRGRPQWNNWGGLNEVFRSQQIGLGLEASAWHFGDVLGVTNIDARPGTIRQGYRFSTSLSNKSYLARMMATYNQPPDSKKLGYTFSASARWGEEGYVAGTGYESFSAYAAAEYLLGSNSSIYASVIFASNTRGSSAAITNEVYELKGRTYNPYWGIQSSKIRNSRIRHIQEPFFLLHYRYQDPNLKLIFGLGYQWGKQSRSRIGYYNAPNPQSDYYRYLPSYHLNSSFGPNFISSSESEAAFMENSQIDWAALYQINQSTRDGRAHYILYDDVSDANIFRSNFNLNWKIWDYSYIDLGVNFSRSRSNFYAQINDLLGADFHLDIDPFSDTLNDLEGNSNRRVNDIFGYNYQLESNNLDAFLQFRFSKAKWNGFLSSRYYNSSFSRRGLYRNGRYPDNSFGKGETIKFSNLGYKAGLSYAITGRHRLYSHVAYFLRPPVLANIYINPRENQEIVPEIQDEKLTSVDINYYIQLPRIGGRISAYYTRFQNTTEVNFFYVDSGVGSDFVQQVLTGLDRLHKGIEAGITYNPSNSVSISTVASISEFLFASDPNITINFDTASSEDDLIDVSGNIDLGLARIKDYHLGRGPSKAVSIGIEYRDPNYWWLGTTLNYLTGNYIHISPIIRTESFKLSPESGEVDPRATDENIARLLTQHPLNPVYLVNLNGGKSWKFGQLYLGVFLSISNLLDAEYKTGGYEQSRNGNFGQLYRDNLSGSPSFGPKFWFGYGRTFFLNLNLSL